MGSSCQVRTGGRARYPPLGAASAARRFKYIKSGDAIPAVLYFPTLLIGLALLLGWS